MSTTPHGVNLHDVEMPDPPSPGEYLQAVIDAHHVSQAELAARSGLSAKHVNQVINGKANVGAETAQALEFATGVEARIWLRLDAEHQSAALLESKRRELIDDKSALNWLGNFSLGELVKRQLITDGPESVQLEQLLRFFGVAKPTAWTAHWGASLPRFRRSPSFAPEHAATAVWLRIGQLKAREVDTGQFDPTALKSRLIELRTITRKNDLSRALRDASNFCAHLGVAVVYASEIAGCRASGAAWRVTKDRAVILLSDRGKREDRLWFSLFHEIGHVVMHARRDTFLDQINPSDDDVPPWHADHNLNHLIIDDASRDSALEQEADDFAQRALIPETEVPNVRAAKSEAELQQVAKRIGVCDGVVAGRWQYDKSNYTRYNDLRRQLPQHVFMEPPPLP
ncbi:ImmA/IrrE family metallo-endopeptidase [soil metagenome]